MIITIDVGNTNITVGVFNGDEIVASFRMTDQNASVHQMSIGMLLSKSFGSRTVFTAMRFRMRLLHR